MWNSIIRRFIIVTQLPKFKVDAYLRGYLSLKGTVMQIEKALINDRLRVTKVS